MKKIGIDARLINQTGVGTYLKNFLHFLEKKLPKNIELNIYLRAEDQNQIDFQNKNIHKRIANYHWHSLGEQLGFLIQLWQDNLDLMHFTYFSLPLFYPGKFITTIHDLTPWIYKTGKASTRNRWLYELKYFFYKLIIIAQVKRSAQIITPTQAVKDDLIRIFGPQLAAKTKVTYEGVNYMLKTVPANQKLVKTLPEKYFLYVGNFYPHKNVEFLINVFSQFREQSLILVGPKDYFSQKISQLIKDRDLEEQVAFFTDAGLADIKYLYQHCLALIHPSLSEGFGLPIIEAMYFQKPIIASRIKPFSELTKDRYFAFDPGDENDLFNQIDHLIKNRVTAVDYGNFEIDFNFEKLAAATLNIYLKHLK